VKRLPKEKMTANKDNVEALEALGLTTTEAKIYLTLVGLGKADARTLWKNADIARQDIYRILTDLQKKSLIEKMIAIPAKYQALPLQDALTILLKNKSDEYKRTEEKAGELLLRLKAKNPEGETKEYELTLGNTEKVNRYRLQRVLKNTKKSIDILDPWENFKHITGVHGDSHTQAAKRKVKYRVITDKPKKGEPVPEIVRTMKKLGYFELRHIPTRPVTSLLITDKREVGIGTDTGKHVTEPRNVLSTNNPCIVALIQNYFELLWLKAAKSNWQ